MAEQFNVVSTMSVLLLLFTSAIRALQGAIDVVAKFGAKADKKMDLSKPLLDVRKKACGSTTPSTIMIPKRTYFLSQAILKGPYKAPIELQVQGTVKAPLDLKAFKEPKWVTFNKIENLKMLGRGVFDGLGTTAYSWQDCAKNEYCSSPPINIRFDFLTNAKIQDITTKDSKQFHVNILGCKNITFEHFTISAPNESPNTYGIHIDGVNVLSSEIKTGDDCVSVGDGAKNVVIKRITYRPGHGISIGSLGKFQNDEPIVGIKVSNCTISNISNGVRIKTWSGFYPGTALDMYFEDITVNNVSSPILVDQKYCPWNKFNIKEESKVKLSNISFKNVRGTSTLPEVVRIICSGGLLCEKVELADIDITYSGLKGLATSQCLNVNPKITGKQNPSACSTPVSPNLSLTI